MRLSARAVIITLILLLGMASGCGWLWPRDNPRDPARCDPACPRGLVCVEGICKLGDGGFPPDLGRDGSQTPDLPMPDLRPPDITTSDLTPDA